jgi:hypothetical protein
MLNDEAFQMIAAEAEQADWDEAIRAAFTDPTIASLTELQSFPQRAEKIEAEWNAYRDDQRVRNVTQAAQLASMLNAGKVNFAEKMLLERAHALRKGTKVNSALGNARDRHPPETIEQTAQMIRALRSGDKRRINEVRAFAGMVLAFGLHPEDAPEVLKRSGFKPGGRTNEQTPPSMADDLTEQEG